MTVPPPMRDGFRAAAESLRPDRARFHPRLREAAAHMDGNRVAPAAQLIAQFLKEHPDDANAHYLMAEAETRLGKIEDAQMHLARSTELAPEFLPARFRYAESLIKSHEPDAALKQATALCTSEPQNPLFLQLNAIACEAAGDFVRAEELWRALINDYPLLPKCRLRHGHVLRALGRQEACIAAYREALATTPSFAESWWALADLKTFRFGGSDIAAMESQLARADTAPQNRAYLHFALGRAYAEAERYDVSFAHYDKGNTLYRRTFHHDSRLLTAYVERCEKLHANDFHRGSGRTGNADAVPIFLVGMTRSGSTLVEQILAGHSQVEATRELFDLTAIARQVQAVIAPRLSTDYPAVLKTLDTATLDELGLQYLERTRPYRTRGLPFFADKMGANYAHVGLIRLILPHAKIVDVRRHPLACGWSIFAQIFPTGQNDSYSLPDIGSHYRDYVRLMAHFDRVLPDSVHRVIYEDLVTSPERETKRLLGYLGLPFEEACLDFHRGEHIVSTASSEQVRRPIYEDALESWRHFEPWLAPLKTALGAVVDSYPAAPEFGIGP